MVITSPQGGGSGRRTRRRGTGESLRVGSVVLRNATKVNENGGMNAPSKRTERGFSWTSRVRAEPRSATFEAWAHTDDVATISSLRDGKNPVSVAFDFVTMGKCRIDDVDITHEAVHPDHVRVRVSVTEVHTPSTGTATVRVTSADGRTQSSSPELSDPTLVRPEEQHTSGGPDESAVDDVKDWLGF